MCLQSKIIQNFNAKLCLVIPCFNEEKGLKVKKYQRFLNNHSNTFLCFVNDGSTDETVQILKQIESAFPHRTSLISYANNKGKAEAVRKGILHCSKYISFEYIGFLDADLSVSLEECFSMTKYLNANILFCFGSRIARIGSNIQRKRFRFLIGRVMATLIAEMLHIKVYDTQCGCKLFDNNLAQSIFAKPFLSKWLFDVEIFFRIIQKFGKVAALKKMLEIPLMEWIDYGNSKVKFSYFFRMLIDLWLIKKSYSNRNVQLLNYDSALLHNQSNT